MQRMILSARLIRERRQSLGLLQGDAARLVGWNSSQPWSKLELRDADPLLSTALAVADALRCRIDALLVGRPRRRRRKKA